MSIIFNRKFDGSPTPYYARVIITDIQNSDNSAVDIEHYFTCFLNSPVNISQDDVTTEFLHQGREFEFDINSEQISETLYDVTISVKAKDNNPFTIEMTDSLAIGFNSATGDPDLSSILDEYLKTMVITADGEPDITGYVNIRCAQAPDEALKNKSVDVNFTLSDTTTFSVMPSETQRQSLVAGSYSISAGTLISDDGNIQATVITTPNSVDIEVGKTADIALTFGQIERYSSLDLSVANIEALENETLQVTLSFSDTMMQPITFTTQIGKTTHFEKLPAGGTLSVAIAPVNKNNQQMTFAIADSTLENALCVVEVTSENVSIHQLPTDGFQTVTVVVDIANELDKAVEVRLISPEMSYVQAITLHNQRQPLAVKVKPGTYSVAIANFILDKTVYSVESQSTLTVDSQPVDLPVTVARGAHLVVRGFSAENLGMGGCATLQTDNEAAFTAARASSIFKYAGTGGDGNPNEFLETDVATINTLTLARKLEENLSSAVLPVMVSYTVQLSGGDVTELQSVDHLTHSFANFILTLQTLMAKKDAAHPVPGGVIVNPDMLGTCQQKNLPPDYAMPVRKPLQDALDHWKIDATIPEDITEDLTGYIRSVNWLVSEVGPDITFGWQINLWGVGKSEWVYGTENDIDVAQAAQETADYIKALQVYDGKYAPDFLAIDRYEADDLTQRAYINVYCYGPAEWAAYFEFCSLVSQHLALPVIPWQIPASRTPLTQDNVHAEFDNQHWGTAANYIFGDKALGSDVMNIHPVIRNFNFSEHGASTIAGYVGATPGDMYQRRGPFDVSAPACRDFALRGIVHMMFGGGTTLGMVLPTGATSDNVDLSWVQQKFSDYAADPVTFEDTIK